MLKSIVPAFGLAIACSASASASFPPKVFKASQDEIAARCESLGERASYTAWNYKADEYGCVDTKTGFVLICKVGTEVCKLYFPGRKFPSKPQKRTADFNRPVPAASTLQNVRAGRGWLSAQRRRNDA